MPYTLFITHSQTVHALTGPTLVQNSHNKPIHLRLSKSFTITGADQYFVIGQNNVTIEGSHHEVVVSYTGGAYRGLVQNGVWNGDNSDVRAYDNVTIKHIKISATSTATLDDYAGWVCQYTFGVNSKGCKVSECVNNAAIGSYNCGGIVGAFAGPLELIKCANTGTIATGLSNEGSGGLVGAFAFTVNAYNCKNRGAINQVASGGIYGYIANNCTATRCRNYAATTANSEQYKGGIFAGYDNSSQIGLDENGLGYYASNCKAICCKNEGNLDHGAAGIFGHSAANCSAEKCYNTGSLGNYSSGIFGNDAEICTAEACFNAGDMVGGSNNGGIFGSAVECSARNCYNSGLLVSNSYGMFAKSTGSSVASANKETHCYVSSLAITGQNPLDAHNTGGEPDNYVIRKSSGLHEATGNWKNRSADKYLLGTDGSIWIKSSRNRPYKLNCKC